MGENTDPIVRGAYTLMSAVYDGLFELTPDNQLAPGIVKSWETAPDGLSWVFRLRDDVVFHPGVNADGTAEPSRKMTAEDVAFSLERMVSEDNVEYGAAAKAIFGDTVKTEIIDQFSLRVYTKQLDVFLPMKLTSAYAPRCYVVPKAYIAKNGLPWFRAHPIGTGPYKFVRIVSGDRQEFEAVDYAHWRTGVPDFKKLTVYLVPEETTVVAMLEKGQLDAAMVSVENAKKLEAEGFTLASAVGNNDNIWFLGAFHPLAQGKPIADVRVRQAMNLAINRQEIIDALFAGQGELPAPPQAGWYYGGWTNALRAKWEAWTKANYRYDPTEAKRLLAEAGYAQGFSIDLMFGQNVEATYQKDLLEAVVSYLKAVGIQATIIPLEKAAWDADRVVRKTTKLVGKMGVISNTGSAPSTWTGLTYFTNMGSLDSFAGSPLEAEMTALVNEANRTVDVAKRAELLDKAVTIVTPTWPSIQICIGPKIFAFSPRVKPFIPSYASNATQFYGDWKYTGVEKK
jgi:peptide/nickel transport system substrate-binding protein